jgi:hypothetical protein
MACCADGVMKKDVSKKVILEKNDDGTATATITTVVNGKEEVTKVSGTEAEVKAKIDSLKKQ